MGEKNIGNFKVKMPDLVRKGRKADITDISVEKIEKANKERGVTVEVTEVTPDKVTAQVDKIVVKGDT
jgi:ribosomal protein S12